MPNDPDPIMNERMKALYYSLAGACFLALLQFIGDKRVAGLSIAGLIVSIPINLSAAFVMEWLLAFDREGSTNMDDHASLLGVAGVTVSLFSLTSAFWNFRPLYGIAFIISSIGMLGLSIWLMKEPPN